MPGSMDGVKLAHFVRERWPPVKIIVTSGFKHVTPDQLPSGSIFLASPMCLSNCHSTYSHSSVPDDIHHA
jgi:hypothetical protein